MDEAQRQLDLVCLALRQGLGGGVEWIDDATIARVRNNPANRGLTPEGIKQLVIQHVRKGGKVDQRQEERAPWRDRREFWYRVVLDLDEFPRGLFVEMELTIDDPDVPMVSLLNAHPQSSS
jgi:hypothetical protein